MLCEHGMKPPSAWLRNEFKIKQTWRVYDAKENHDFCFLSPLFGEEIHSSQAIAEVLKQYVGDWPYASAELIRWDSLLPGQEVYVG